MTFDGCALETARAGWGPSVYGICGIYVLEGLQIREETRKTDAAVHRVASCPIAVGVGVKPPVNYRFIFAAMLRIEIAVRGVACG